MAKKFITIILLLCYTTIIYASEELTISSRVSKNSVTSGETFELTVEIKGKSSSLPSPSNPTIKNAEILGTSTSTSMEIINFSMSVKKSYTYTLRPLIDKGVIIIPPFKVKYKGKTYLSNSIKVTVSHNPRPNNQNNTQNKNNPNPNLSSRYISKSRDNDVMVFASVSNKTPYVGEQIIYAFTLYYRTSFAGNPDYQKPKFNGFWVEELPDIKTTKKFYKGIAYNVKQIRYALFPTQEGETTIEPATFSYISFKNGLFAHSPRQVLKTQPIKINVKPLPSFNGNNNIGYVGDLQIDDKLLTKNFKVGNPITLQVTVSGNGNIKSLKLPHLDSTPEFEIFDPEISSQVRTTYNGVVGKKIFKYIFIPQRAGKLTLPQIKFTFFSTKYKKYQSLNTRLYKIDVKAADKTNITLDKNISNNKSQVNILNFDIHFINEKFPLIVNQKRNIFDSGWFWILLIGGLSYPLIGFGLLYYQKNLGKSSKLYYQKNAEKIALKGLEKIKKFIQDEKSDKYYEEFTKILLDFIEHKFQIKAKIMTTDQIIDELKKLYAENHFIEKLENIFVSLDLARFSFSKETIQKENLLKIEKEFTDFINETRSVQHGQE